MSASVTQRDTGHDYTARVANEGDLNSPVVVTSGNYTVQFDGNNFASKHLRRIRRNSVTILSKGGGGGKIDEYMSESTDKAWERFNGNAHATSTFIFLDLDQFCQFGCQVIKFLSGDNTAWAAYPPAPAAAQCLQKHCQVTINKCFASSNSGFGQVRENANNAQRLQHGIGITLNVTVKQPLGGNGRTVQVCHYAGGGVTNEFSPGTTSTGGKMKDIGKSIVT